MSCKKIAIITPFLAQGGLEKVAVLQAKELSKIYDVTLIVMDSFQIDYPYNGKMINLNISLLNRNIFNRLYNITLAIIKLYKLKKQYKYDLVVSHGELANLPNIFSMGLKNILVIHGDRFAEMTLEDIQSRYISKIIKKLYFFKNVSKIVTVSEGIRESFLEVLKIEENRIVTIYNPFELDKIENLSNKSLNEYEDLFLSDVLITVGRLNSLKGQWYLLRIFKVLKEKNTTLKLIILGDGEMRDDLISLSNDLGLQTFTRWGEKTFDTNYDVYFLGFQENPFKFLKAARLFIMTSLSEGFGNTIVESMVSQTPVVSSDCKSGPREILYPEVKKKLNNEYVLYDGYGVLIPPFDNRIVGAVEELDNKEQLWVDTLENLLNDKEKMSKYSVSGLERVRDFKIDIIINEWKTLINDVINQ